MPTATNTLQPTPTRILPETATPTATPTPAPSVTARSLAQALPTFTSLPTLDQTEIAELLATPPPRPTLPATWTPVPTLPPPPVFATAPRTQAAGGAGFNTPLPSTPQAQFGFSTATPTPTATLFQPTVAVRRDLLREVIPPPVSLPTSFSFTSASAYDYNVGPGQIFSYDTIQLSGGVRLFVQNPVDPGSYLRTDDRGILRYKPIGVPQEGEMSYSPFFHGYSGQIADIKQNKNYIAEMDWSADGQQFSFRVDTPPGLDNGAAGVWFWQPHATNQIIRDCASPAYKPCNFVCPSSAKHWKTLGVDWSPLNRDNTVLLTLHLPEEMRNALAIAQAVPDSTYANNAPPFIRYDYGYWNRDGQSITVSGRRPDHRVIIGVVNRDLAGEQIILDGSARGLWLRDAVQRPNGEYVALGRPGGPGSGPVALYDQYGVPISPYIGHAPPETVRWYPDRSAVVLVVQERQYTVPADNGVVTDTTDMTYNPQFSQHGLGSSPQPESVVVGSEYYPGQQLRVIVPSLNIREEPSTDSRAISWLAEGDYVAIFAGPYVDTQYRWWRVQTARNLFGWIAATINGAPTVLPGF